MNIVSSRPGGFYRHGYHLDGAVSSRVPGYFQHGGHLGAHRPGGFYDHTLGQFDPSSGITGDIMLGPEEPAPPDSGILSPYQTYGAAYPDTTPQYAPAPTVSVPKPGPSSSPIFATFGPYGTLDPTAAPNTVSSSGTLPPGPSPRVNVPLSPSSFGMWFSNSSLITGVPNWLVLGGGLLAIPLIGGLIGGGGGRRRRR